MVMVRHSKGHLGAGAAVLACIFLSWLILLAGIAACQRQVQDRSSLEFEWWITAFEFVLVLLSATHLSGYHRSHAGLVALKAVNTVLCMVYAQIWNKFYRQGGTQGVTDLPYYPTSGDTILVTGPTPRRIETALAGFVLLSIFNTLLLAVLGTAPTVTATAYNNQEVRSTRGAPVGTGAAAAPYATTAGAPVSAGTGVAGAGQTVV